MGQEFIGYKGQGGPVMGVDLVACLKDTTDPKEN